ncbi:MAG: putative metal-binding motif-containing protein, partial [Myxococcota bacterium]
TDCLDSDVDAFPGAAQLESAGVCRRDADDDGYGDASATSPVSPGIDCNDVEPTAYPAHPEVCYDLVDNNCNSQMDCGEGTCTGFCTVSFVSVPDSPTGWIEAGGAEIEMTFSDLDPSAPSSTTYECRTGRVATVSSKAWQPCDGGTGATAVHHPTPTVGSEDGTQRTEVRLRFDASAVTPAPYAHYDFYAHRSLDGAQTCSLPVTDAALFTAAASRFVTTPAFDAANMTLENPFLTIKFSSWSLGPQTLQPLSLRHRFVLNVTNTMLLMTRRFTSLRNPSVVGCRATMMDVHRGIAISDIDWHEDSTEMPCDAVVFNQESIAVCLLVTAGPVITPTWVKRPESFQLDEKTFSPKTTTAPAPAGSLLLPP